jgi:hypothetical protein
MRELVFAMELRSRAAPVEGKAATLRAQTSGRSPAGETVNFVSEVVLTGEHFHETGHIEYAGRGQVAFETVGVGHFGPTSRNPVGGGHLARDRRDRRVSRRHRVYHLQQLYRVWHRRGGG